MNESRWTNTFLLSTVIVVSLCFFATWPKKRDESSLEERAKWAEEAKVQLAIKQEKRDSAKRITGAFGVAFGSTNVTSILRSEPLTVDFRKSWSRNTEESRFEAPDGYAAFREYRLKRTPLSGRVYEVAAYASEMEAEEARQEWVDLRDILHDSYGPSDQFIAGLQGESHETANAWTQLVSRAAIILSVTLNRERVGANPMLRWPGQDSRTSKLSIRYVSFDELANADREAVELKQMLEERERAVSTEEEQRRKDEVANRKKSGL